MTVHRPVRLGLRHSLCHVLGMPRRTRTSTEGLVFHVLNRGAKKSQLFDDSHDYAAFEQLLRRALRRCDIALYAYCLMPNHWHFVVSPRRDGELSRFMHWLTTTHAMRRNVSRGDIGLGAVYQARFKAFPLSTDTSFLRVCRYVERNPLRAVLVGRAQDWRWSSLWRVTNHCNDSLISQWPVMRPDNWIALVNEPQTAAELASIRTAVERELPLGDAQWQQNLPAALRGPKIRRPRLRIRPTA